MSEALGFRVWDAVTNLEPDLDRITAATSTRGNATEVVYIGLPGGPRPDDQYPASLTVFSFNRTVTDPSTLARQALLEFAIPYSESEGLDRGAALHRLTELSMREGELADLVVDGERIEARRVRVGSVGWSGLVRYWIDAGC